MKTEIGFRGFFSFLIFAIFLLVPSSDTILKYFGIIGLAAYLLFGALALFAVLKLLLPAFLSRITQKQANILAVGTFLILSLMVLYLYPLANSGRLGGGTDVDDAMIIAVNELIRGNYPYYPKTYLGLPISPMPGAIFLATPFVLLNLVAFQNIFWLAVLFLVARYYLQSSSLVLALFWLFLSFSPTVMQNLATGTDYVANTIYILIFMWLMVDMISRPQTAEWKKLLPTLLLGVGLSSRSNFILLMPLLFSILVQNAGWKPALKYMSIAGSAFLLVTVPFWLYDPKGFTPLTLQSGRIIELQTVLPYAGIIIPLSSIFLTLALSLQKMEKNCVIFFRNCAIVQLFTLLFMAIVHSIFIGELILFLGSAGYGMFTMFFGVLAGWIALRMNEGDLLQNQ